METNRDIEKLGFVPSENHDLVVADVRAWLTEHVLPHVAVGDMTRRELVTYEGGYLYITLGGRVPHPTKPEVTIDAEATLCISSRDQHDRVEDEDGTWWYRTGITATVNWPSYGSSQPGLAVRRAEVISLASRLACEFEDAFGDVFIWSRGPTKAERDERAAALEAQRALDFCVSRARVAIRKAIHTTHKRMRVGSDGFIGPFGIKESHRFTVEVEKKEYEVVVYVPDDGSDELSMLFTRTK